MLFCNKDLVWKKISLLIPLGALFLSALSQNGAGMQFLSNVNQQASTSNPAWQNQSDELVIGLPIFSGINFQWNANFTIKNTLGNNFSPDYGEFYDALNEDGDAFTTFSFPLFFLSLKSKNNTFSFSISDKVIATTTFDRELLNFIAQGLQPYYGKNESFGPVSLKANYYREIAFGYSYEIWEGLNVGVRPKILFNKFFYNLENASFNVETKSEQQQLIIHPDGNYTISGPVEVTYDEETEAVSLSPALKPADYFFRLRNMGAAIDLGISFKVHKQTEVSISALDLGFSSQKYKTYNVAFSNDLHYQQEDLYQSTDTLASNYLAPAKALAALNDSVPLITTVDATASRNIEILPVNFNLLVKHKLPNNVQFGVSNQFTWYKNHSTNFATGFISSAFGNNFEAAAALTLYNFEKIMPGISCCYTGQAAQFYFSTNNIVELLKPTSAKTLNLCFGVNFLFPTD